jgi:hypothetical protein
MRRFATNAIQMSLAVYAGLLVSPVVISADHMLHHAVRLLAAAFGAAG